MTLRRPGSRLRRWLSSSRLYVSCSRLSCVHSSIGGPLHKVHRTCAPSVRLRLGLRHRPRWGNLQSSSEPLAGLEGLLLRGGSRGEGRGRDGRKGRVREGRKGRGGRGQPEIFTWIDAFEKTYFIQHWPSRYIKLNDL